LPPEDCDLAVQAGADITAGMLDEIERKLLAAVKVIDQAEER
jgi:hypothetical protein